MKSIIETKNLSKNYGPVQAVDGISLNVNRGEIYGFLGINGAGKTTTIRLLLGMINPTVGSAYLFGKEVNPSENNIWEKVGYIVESPYSYPDLTVRENLEIVRRLRQISGKKTLEKIVNRLKLTSYRDIKAKNLSTGNAQRLGLAKALLHEPEVLLLDEPANGLDPTGIVEIRQLLHELAFEQGVTIFISSHILSEISRLATRIGIIHQGQLIQEVDRNELEQLRQKRLLIDAHNQQGVEETLIKTGFSVTGHDQGNLEVKDKRAINHPEKIANIMVKAGYPPTLLKVEEEDLESYFLRLIGVKEGDIKWEN